MALMSIVLFSIWTYIGYNTVIFLAGLGSIPPRCTRLARSMAQQMAAFQAHHLAPAFTRHLLPGPDRLYWDLSKLSTIIYVMRVPSAQGTVDVTSVS